ncbi:uncharacterized protein LOC134244051 [Saccostrea cucullata]|uniref:uncharacterized protein LOC134244051 n=1 Tax=Saccostrea cuccullata TaxID=36930 RepID=UPI002ED12821
MESYDYHVVGTVHNFGVFKNSGKKVILQIDFKTNKISLIKKGAIQYKCDFDDLSYDSEEGVLFCIKVGGKQIELTAENLEEKTAICRLLSIVQCNAADLVKRELRGSSGGISDDVVRTRTASVIKEGVLEKKGNATIQLWAKRKVKVTPGMFSYYKTDEQSALNVVPLKPNQYHVKSVGNSGFNVIFPKRTYYFRLTSSNAPSSQTERDGWIQAFTSACQEKRRTVIDFESSGLEPTHQPNNKFMLSVGSLSQSDDSMYDQVYAEEGVKSTEIHTEAETQTEKEERLSAEVPKSEPLKSATKDRPKTKQPLVAVKSLIPEESEQERNEEIPSNQTKTESENTQDVPVVNDLYDVVKDILYSSSEDNLSEGHEEMVCPEGDYADPEEEPCIPQQVSAKTGAECPTYEDITEGTKSPELKSAQEIQNDNPETPLYSEVRKISYDADNGNRSDVSNDEKDQKETPVYAKSLKKKQNQRRDSLKQREVLPPPPPPPISPIPSQPPCQVVTESHTEDKNQERKLRKKSLARPPSQPPPPPSPKDRQSTSSGTSDLSRSSASDKIEPQKTIDDLPLTLLTPPKDRHSTSSFSSDLSQSSAGKSAVSSEVEREEATDTSASESPRLSFSQFIEASLSEFSLASELEPSTPLSPDNNNKQVSVDSDEQKKVNTELTPDENNESTSIINKEQISVANTDSSSVDNSDSLSAAENDEQVVNNEQMSDIKDESVSSENKEASSVADRDHTSTATADQRSSRPVQPLPQWPPPSENDSLPPQQPSHVPTPPPPPSIPQAPAPPPAPTTKRPTKLRTLHWSKLSKSQIKSSFWKHATDRKSNINTELILHHFSVVDDSQQQHKSAEPSLSGTKLLLDATRARNLGIILTGLKAEGARHIREVLNSVTEDEYFPAEKLTTIRRYQPTSDDIELFRLYSDKKSTLDPVDRFMCELCEIECIGTRLDFILLLWDFPRQLKCTNESIEELSQACSDLKTNTHLVQLMEYILAIGNFMNNDHKTHGFPVTSLRMFMDMRGKTTDFTFSHFLVELLEEKEPEVIRWIQTMDSVAKCKNINIKALVVEIDVLKSDLTKLKKNLKTLKSKIKKPNEMETDFLHKAQLLLVNFEGSMHSLEKESARIQATYRHLLEYFGESASVPSNELFSVLSDFAQKFRKSVDDINRRKRYQTLHQNSLM